MTVYVYAGLAFWRAPRRKVYAVEETTLQADVDVSDESSDVEDTSTTYVPPAKKFRRKTSRDIRSIKEEMSSLRASIQRIVPACLKDQLTTVFRCCIMPISANQTSHSCFKLLWQHPRL